MASFCKDCTDELFGTQYASQNDMVRPELSDDEFAGDLCEHCGYGYFDKEGQRVSDYPEDYEDLNNQNYLWSASQRGWIKQ